MAARVEISLEIGTHFVAPILGMRIDEHDPVFRKVRYTLIEVDVTDQTQTTEARFGEGAMQRFREAHTSCSFIRDFSLDGNRSHTTEHISCGLPTANVVSPRGSALALC